MNKVMLSKASPGLVKECRYLAKCLHGKYYHYLQFKLHTIFKCKKGTVLHIYNTSISTPFLIIVARLLSLEIVFYCHEPNKKDTLKYYPMKIHLKNYFIKWINYLCLLLCNCSRVFSPYGLERAEKYFLLRLLKKIPQQQNLLLPEIKNTKPKQRGKYILLFGQLNDTKSPYWISDYVRNSTSLPCLGKLVVLTASENYKHLENLEKEFPQRFSIIRRRELSDAVISQYLNKSFVSVHLHHCVTQSGAVVESWRHGVPTVCLDTPGFSQFQFGNNMKLIRNYHYTELDEVIIKIAKRWRLNWDDCKKIFSDNFTFDRN